MVIIPEPPTQENNPNLQSSKKNCALIYIPAVLATQCKITKTKNSRQVTARAKQKKKSKKNLGHSKTQNKKQYKISL